MLPLCSALLTRRLGLAGTCYRELYRHSAGVRALHSVYEPKHAGWLGGLKQTRCAGLVGFIVIRPAACSSGNSSSRGNTHT